MPNPSLSDDDLVRLKELAERCLRDRWNAPMHFTGKQLDFIEACRPQTILSLLSRIEQLGSEVARLKAMFDRERDFKWLQAQRAQSAESRLAEVTEALRPFAKAAGWIPRGWPADKSIDLMPFCLTAEDFRKADAALSTPATPPSRETGSSITDDFNGDTDGLRRSIKALIEMDDSGALVPHGIGGHARTLLAAAYHRLNPSREVGEDEVDAVWQEVVEACSGAWPDRKNIFYSDSPIELIIEIINERDEARAALSSAAPSREDAERVARAIEAELFRVVELGTSRGIITPERIARAALAAMPRTQEKSNG